MKSNVKTGIAMALCALLIAAGCLIAATLLWQAEKASSPQHSPETASVESQVEDDVFPVIDWGWWKSQNPDVIGWITIPGTRIDLPICQAPADDPTYYLTHDVYGKWNIYGCPYLDSECAQKGFESALPMVFGHHMDDGSMFAPIARYSDGGYATEHREILLQTPGRKMRLAVASADVVDSYREFKRLDFKDKEALWEWWGQTLASSDVAIDSQSLEPSSVFAFVTCSYGRWNGHERTIVYAVESDRQTKATTEAMDE